MEYEIRITGSGKRKDLIDDMVKLASYINDNPQTINEDEPFRWETPTIFCEITTTNNEDED